VSRVNTAHVDVPATPAGDVDQADDQSLPTTPHRAFHAFNDSVDNVNLEDLRDMLPEDTWRDVQPDGLTDGIAANHEDLDVTLLGPDGAQSALNAIPEGDQESGSTPAVSPLRNTLRSPASSAAKKAEHPRNSTSSREKELELELLSAEECSSGTESLGHAEGLTSGPESGKRVVAELYEPKYRYGPAVTKKRRGRDVFAGLQGDGSAGGRSYAEVAEAVVLTVLDAVRPGNSPTFRTDEPKSGSGSDEVTQREERTAGLGRRVRGALGYVLHTALSLVYTVCIHYPLELLLAVVGFWWNLTTSVFGAVLGAASYLWGVYVWCLLLPVRLAQRAAVLVWQKALLLAVQFLNSHPAAWAADTDPHATQKHTIPTALNGHAHHKH